MKSIVCAFFASSILLIGAEIEILGDRVNLRASTNGNSEVVMQAAYGERFELRGEVSDPWVAVKLPEKADTWMYSSLISNGVVITRAKIRAGAGFNYNTLGIAPTGTRVTVRGQQGEWTRIAAPDMASAYVTNLYVRIVSSPDETTQDSEEPAELAPAQTQTPEIVVAHPETLATSATEPAIDKTQEQIPIQPPKADIVALSEALSTSATSTMPVETPLVAPPAAESAIVEQENDDVIEILEGLSAPDMSNEVSPSEPERHFATSTRRTLLDSSTPNTLRGKVGPAEIPASQLKSEVAQAIPGKFFGILTRSPASGIHPTRYRLVTFEGSLPKTVCYVYGNNRQLQDLSGESMEISGAVYWFRDTTLPTIFAQDILRGVRR